MDVALFHILHIRNEGIYGTQNDIVTKHLSSISPVSSYKFISTSKRLMWEYKESGHLTHILINPYSSTHDMTGWNEHT